MPACSPPAPTTWPTRSRPRPNRCWWRRPAAWTQPACARWSAICARCSTRPHRRPGRTPPWAAGVVADRHLGGHGGGGWAAGARGRPEPAGRPGAPGPASATDARSGGQRRADALAELARRSLEGGRLACDGAVTRVLVTRQPTSPGPGVHLDDRGGHPDPGGPAGLTDQLQTAAALLPPVLGGAPTQPLEVGRTTRVVQPGQRLAWPCATAAASSLAATGPLPGVRPIICGTGGMAAPPTWTTWSCCAGLIIGPSMRRLAADPPARRAAHRHPTPPTPAKTPGRGLSREHADLQLAAELGVLPNALYTYVPDKEALLDAPIDDLLAGIEADEPAAGDWRDGLASVMDSSRRLLLSHPQLVPVFLARPGLGPCGPVG